MKPKSLDLITGAVKDTKALTWPDSPFRPPTPPAVWRMRWKKGRVETEASKTAIACPKGRVVSVDGRKEGLRSVNPWEVLC